LQISHLFTHFDIIITKTCKQSIRFQNYKNSLLTLSFLIISRKKLSCKYLILCIIESNVLIVTSFANV
ncbi:unnamed protein product, partial [Brassica rapa]